MKADKIPEATITRLSMYSRYLTKMEEQNVQKVSSVDIAQGVQGTPAQVRKDLAYFGDFGMRGVGYNVAGLNNFSPASLITCDSIEIRQIDLAVSLEGLSYRIKNKYED